VASNKGALGFRQDFVDFQQDLNKGHIKKIQVWQLSFDT
jgi:hypothetical protein